MQLFTVYDLLIAVLHAFSIAHELTGAFAETTIQAALLPFHDFSIGTVLAAIGACAILWKNKGWIFSGLSHIFHLSDFLSTNYQT